MSSYGFPGIVKTAQVLQSSLDMGSPSGRPWEPKGPLKSLKNPRVHPGTSRDPPGTPGSSQGPTQGPPRHRTGGPETPPVTPEAPQGHFRGPPGTPQAHHRCPQGPFKAPWRSPQTIPRDHKGCSSSPGAARIHEQPSNQQPSASSHQPAAIGQQPTANSKTLEAVPAAFILRRRKNSPGDPHGFPSALSLARRNARSD